MFKSLWKRFKENNFLAEGEEQVKFQEDPSVTKPKDVKLNENKPERHYIRAATGNVLLCVNEFKVYFHTTQGLKESGFILKAPTLSLLKMIKKRFDEGVVPQFSKRLYNRDKYIHLTDSEFLYFNGYRSNVKAEDLYVSCSLNFLDCAEKHWIKVYTAYRLEQNQEQENQKKRDVLEQKLQSILNEGEEE